MQTALKLPYAGFRDWNDGDMNYQGSGGFCWSSSSNGTNVYGMGFYYDSINLNYLNGRSRGFSVRCFKN